MALASGVAACPLVGHAQVVDRKRRIGVLMEIPKPRNGSQHSRRVSKNADGRARAMLRLTIGLPAAVRAYFSHLPKSSLHWNPT
jgi:hypothetical protein